MTNLKDSEKNAVPYLMSQVLDSCINGITLSDPAQEDCPIVYASAAFELMTGYEQAEIIGRNCRFLQGQDRDQKGAAKIKQAMESQKPVTVLLRNYRKNGEMFYNELTIKPLYDQRGNVVFYAGIQNDVTQEVELELEKMAKEKISSGRQRAARAAQ